MANVSCKNEIFVHQICGLAKKTGGSSAIDGGFVRDLNTAGGIQVVGIATLMSLVAGLVFDVRKHLTEIGGKSDGYIFSGGWFGGSTS